MRSGHKERAEIMAKSDDQQQGEITERTLVFDDSKLSQQVSAGMSQIGIALAFFTTVIGLLGKHDIAGLVTFMQSSAALPALTLLAGFVLFVWRQLKLRQRVEKTNALVDTVDNSVAVKKSELPAEQPVGLGIPPPPPPLN